MRSLSNVKISTTLAAEEGREGYMVLGDQLRHKQHILTFAEKSECYQTPNKKFTSLAVDS